MNNNVLVLRGVTTGKTRRGLVLKKDRTPAADRA